MSNNASLVAEIEALLASAKSYQNVDLVSDRLARLDLVGKVEALHYQLDDPAEAMFRQITNVNGKQSLTHQSKHRPIQWTHRPGSFSTPRLRL
jgi:hypothetical protein